MTHNNFIINILGKYKHATIMESKTLTMADKNSGFVKYIMFHM